MERLLEPEERQQIEAIAMAEDIKKFSRRAQLLLLYDDGLQTKEVAQQVGLSPGRVRYWRRQYQNKGMDIFSSSIQDKSASSEGEEGADTPVLPPPQEAHPLGTEQDQTEALSVWELHHRYHPDPHRAQHLLDSALTLFDQTQSIHHLTDNHRRLLTAAVLLLGLQLPIGVSKRKIFKGPIPDLNATGQKMVVNILDHQRGKSVRRSMAQLSQLPHLEREALALAAIIRIADGLDSSGTQETNIRVIENRAGQMLILVEGPKASLDARAAQRRAKLWQDLFQQRVSVRVSRLEDQALSEADLNDLYALQEPGVVPQDPLAEAGRKVLRYHFAQMLRHEDGTRLGEDIEELHDMRVATRRMRAAFEVFGDAFEPKAIKSHLKGLKATGRALGRVRDMDVFMEKAQAYLQNLPEDQRPGLDPLLQAWMQERESDRVKMLVHLDGPDYQAFKRGFLEFLNTPGVGARPLPQDRPVPYLVEQIAPGLIYTRLAAVRAYDLVLKTATIEQLHGLRIEFKKLRYTVEFFREVLGEEAKVVIDEIKSLQDHLGDLNDANVACQILRDFLGNWEERQSGLPLSERQNPEPVVAYLAAKHAERYRLMVTFQQAWNHFNRPEFHRNLALSISVL